MTVRLLSFLVLLIFSGPASGLSVTPPQFVSGQAADLVLFQPDFTSNLNSLGSRDVSSPLGLAIDPTTGKLFVADSTNNRVLRLASVFALVTNAGAEAVFGQSNFTDTGNATTRTTLANPSGITVDELGRLWVADQGNNRVIMWEAASLRSTGAEADRVLGQLDYTSNGGSGGPNGMTNPSAVAVDSDDRLWVVDTSNHRVLRFDAVSSKFNGSFAQAVLGQTNFSDNFSGLSDSKLNFPLSLTVDSGGRVWVADSGNNRLLRFDDAALKANGAAADGVLGQTDFLTGFPPPLPSATSLAEPQALTVDSAGTLWVADTFSGRVVGYPNAAALPDGAAASIVLGQPDFGTVDLSRSARGPILSAGLAFDALGRLWVTDVSAHRVLRFTPPPPVVAPADFTRPTLKVRGRKTIESKRNRIVIRGTATDASGIARVEFKAGKGSFRSAKGGVSWKVIVRPGESRKTVVKIRALDAFGNRSAVAKVKIIRR